ncbi:hypothetical protein NESM_000688000 [Novymonas esmeraldas]|uniref:Uncharacterized protein n=1 Tax=Novymonas esmeraldas TaxID=1808958 RepID=A0AAW0ETA9_9TRYP
MTSNSDEGSSGTPPPSRGAAVSAFIEEATDIRDLLHRYRANTELLKEDLSGFVHRDIDEQAQFSHLRATVTRAELASLHDSRFLQYLARRDAEERTVVQPAAATCPLEKTKPTDTTCASQPWWSKRVEALSGIGLSEWAPDAAVQMTAFGTLAAVCKGWKRSSSTSEAELERMLETVFPGALSSSDDSVARFCCFGNGSLCDFPFSEDASVAAELEARIPQIATCSQALFSETVYSGDGGCAVVGALDGYYCALTQSLSVTRDRLRRLIETLVQPAQAGDRGTAADRLGLTGDAWDTLAFVRPDRLSHTVPVRGFFFKGQLALVEQLGAEVDIVPLFHRVAVDCSSPEERARRVREYLAQTLRTVYAMLDRVCAALNEPAATALPPNAALTVAVRVPMSQCESAAGVLLDVHPLSPQLSFCGRVTWMDVCAIGQQRAGAAESTSHETADDVLFRVTQLPVACLQAYDPVSRRIFPALNAQLAATQRETHQTSTTPALPRASSDSHSSYTTAAAALPICIGIVACAAVAIGAARPST